MDQCSVLLEVHQDQWECEVHLDHEEWDHPQVEWMDPHMDLWDEAFHRE